jgi:hypothetical protein
MKRPPKVSTTRLRHRILAICEDANALGDLISEIAHEAKNPTEALLLAAKAHEIAILAVGPQVFGKVFKGYADDVALTAQHRPPPSRR